MAKTVVFSLGGSLIVPDKIDIDYLKQFRKFLMQYIEQGNRAVVVCGGGRTARLYQDAGRSLKEITDEDLDWLGIAATRLNAELLRAMMAEDAYEAVVRDPNADIQTDKPLIFAGGYTPGSSSDKVAVMLAKKFRADSVVNMTNIDYVYDSDPGRNKDAQPLKNLSWKEFLGITGEEWVPGRNVPFDPVAGRLARDNNIKVIILNGKDLGNLRCCVEEKKFNGSVIG